MLDSNKILESPQEIAQVAPRLREIALNQPIGLQTVLDVFEKWSAGLNASDLREIPGVTFLRLWLRRGTLESMLARELGGESLNGNWREIGLAKLRAFPVGVVGHWPAGNIEIQPILSLTCAMLGGNSSIVRIPSESTDAVGKILSRLWECDSGGCLTQRIAVTRFDHNDREMHVAMAKAVDGALIWGGAEAVAAVRGLPFPTWSRLVVFGPRLSVGAMDGGAWSNREERLSWCRRIARDVWQFNQEACSSPQTLFLERCPGSDPTEFVVDLRQAFEEENRAHPRREIHPALTSAICMARASWLLNDTANQASFPLSPDWTILQGEGTEIPTPTQGRTLTVLVVDDLIKVISRFDGTVQTLGLAMRNKGREEELVQVAAYHGVDRIVRLGQMHTFGSPWDGSDLVRPFVRMVRHLPSQSGDES